MTKTLVALGFALVLLAPSGAAGADDFAWIEAEKPASANVTPKLVGWGHPEFLSGGAWLSLSIDADKVEKEVPADGVLLAYRFALPKDGTYEVWNRVGFEFVRSPFQWRIDKGDWADARPDSLTTDCMELDFWCEVAWLKLGAPALAKGDHTLEIRLPRTQDDKGKTARVLYASDALCVYGGTFRPNSKHKPGEDWQGDQDRQAAKVVFDVPEPASADARASVALKGLWEVCRHDEQMPGEVAAPIKDFPAKAYWTAIEVPGDKNTQRPDLLFAHRLWYRTRVRVPESCAGRSFHIVFPENNLNTTVFVNGQYCGFDKNPFARVQIDVTRAVKPGVNEVWVGIKDAWYGRAADPERPLKLRKTFNVPLKYFGDGFQDLAYPVWNHPQSGLLLAPEFVVAGPVKAADVFCKPSVAKKQLAVEVTLANPGAKDAAGEVVCEAVGAASGKVEKTFAPKPFALKAGASEVVEVAEAWDNPRLWWPDDPQMYRLRVTVKMGGKAVDTSETAFGFREWSWKGRDFRLNGVVWHGWADCFNVDGPKEWLAFYRKNNERMMRFWGTRWQGMTPEEALAFFDASGVVCRRSGILDGEAIGYMAIENDPELKKKNGSEIKMDLMRNWQDQVVARVRGERNHPSVMIWSIENEWLYINCINLYGGLMDQFEAEVKKVSDAVQAADPTRPTMNDGGGAHKNNAMPVAGDHYVTGSYPSYPPLAYDVNTKGGGRGRWEWDEKRPRFIGEDFYITGNNPELAYFGGEEAFQGKAATRPAASIITRMLVEGYRWAGQGAWHFWMGQNDAPDQYVSYAPRAVFCRQWDWTFGSGAKVTRTLGIFNDSHVADPIAFTWTLTVGGKKVGGATTEHRLAGGTSEKFDLVLQMPTVDARQEGELVLALAVGGKEVFRDTKPVSVLCTDPRRCPVPGLETLKAGDLCVCDPAGAAAAFLKASGVPFTPLADLAALPEKAKVLVIGPGAVTAAESASSRLAAWASQGRRLIVLEQKTPLRYQAVLPAEMEPAENQGYTAFGEDLAHPALGGLQQKDFFTWNPGEVVYRNAYAKPSRGARSLVQCHELLQNSALVEVPVGDGLLVLSQLCLGEKIAENAVAQRLLLNLVAYAATYKLEFRTVAAAAQGDAALAKAVDEVGLKYAPAAGPLEALASPGVRLAVVSATPAHLKALADGADKVKAFTANGGWIVLCGLAPEGLADYNRLVGFDHMIRPMRRERVTLAARRHPLMSGLTIGDVALYGSERIFPWTQGNYVAGDTFAWVVDYEDVAPFAEFPKENIEHPDWNRSNMVNGMVSADAWKYIVNTTLPENGPLTFPLKFPKAVTIREMEWIGNTFYYPVTKVRLIFDGDDKGAAAFDTRPDNEPQTFAIDPPRTGKDITLHLAAWQAVPGKQAITGLDNIRLMAVRPPEFYQKVQPMLNIGGLMAYPRGEGGLVLCNLLFKDKEDVPENFKKKRTIFSTILRNLKAPFAGGKAIIAGARLNYQPVDLSKQANQYRTDRGWFGDKAFTFKDMPAGRQTLAGVPFEIYDFPTSPVPTVVMLGGGGVPNNPPEAVRGLPVGRKADALFFLHTARVDARRNRDEIKKNQKFELFRYVVTYADGKTETVPVLSEIDVDDYRQKEPQAIPGAQIAWTRPWEGTEFSAVAYMMQWNNPRPDVAIASIDMVYAGKDRRGVPVLIAVTAASAE